jgi:hypothetical protein
MLLEHPYSRAEFDWLACDAEGLLGYFSTAGAGPVPRAAIQDGPFLEDVLDRVKELGRTGSAISISGLLNPRDWLDVAERGFFAFDWSRRHNRYELTAKPSMPRKIVSIEMLELGRVAARVRLDAAFSQTTFLMLSG